MKKSKRQRQLEKYFEEQTSSEDNEIKIDGVSNEEVINNEKAHADLENAQLDNLDLNHDNDEAVEDKLASISQTLEQESIATSDDLDKSVSEDENKQEELLKLAKEATATGSESEPDDSIIEPPKQKAKKSKEEPVTFRKNLYSCFFKRFFDIILSGLALIILSPVIAVVAILVRCKLGKGVIFVQWRLSKNNKPFKLYKFRTMKNAYTKNGDLLPDEERVTKFGTAIRKTSLDELPQLWNIFKGDMSIIGPRPRMIQECVFLDEEMLNVRSYVRPGLTGLAQINGRNNITFDKVVQYDKEYVKTINLWLDTKIFFKTIAKVFKHDDINKNGTVSNEFYGDMLLRTGVITTEEYNEKQNLAKEIIKKAS